MNTRSSQRSNFQPTCFSRPVSTKPNPLWKWTEAVLARVHPADHRMLAERAGGVEQGRHHLLADALPVMVAVHIDGVLDRVAVALPLSEFPEAGEADHVPVERGDNERQALRLALVQQQAAAFEVHRMDAPGGRRVEDGVVVDVQDRRKVALLRIAQRDGLGERGRRRRH